MTKIFIFRDRFDTLRIWDGSVGYKHIDTGSGKSVAEKLSFLQQPENWPIIQSDDVLKYGKKINTVNIERETVYSFHVRGGIKQDPTIAFRDIPHIERSNPSQGVGSLDSPPGGIKYGPRSKRPNFIRNSLAPTQDGIGGQIYFDERGIPTKYKPKQQKKYIARYEHIYDPASNFYFPQEVEKIYWQKPRLEFQQGQKSAEARSSTKESSFIQRDFTYEDSKKTGKMIWDAMMGDGEAADRISRIEESDDYYRYAGFYGLTYEDRLNFIHKFEVDPSMEYDPESPLNPDIAGTAFRTQPYAYLISHQQTRIMAQQMARAVLIGRLREESIDEREIVNGLKDMYMDPFHGSTTARKYLNNYITSAEQRWGNLVNATMKRTRGRGGEERYSRAIVEMSLAKRFPEMVPPKIEESIADDAYVASSGMSQMRFGSKFMDINLMQELDKMRMPYVHALMSELARTPLAAEGALKLFAKAGLDENLLIDELFRKNKRARQLYNKLFHQYPVSDRPYELGPLNKPFGRQASDYWIQTAQTSPFFRPEDMFKTERFSIHWPEFEPTSVNLRKDSAFVGSMLSMYPVGGRNVSVKDMLDPSKNRYYTRDLNNAMSIVEKELRNKRTPYLALPVMSRGRFSDFFIVNMHEKITLTLDNFKVKVPVIFNECARRGVKPIIAAADRYVKTTENILDTYTGKTVLQDSMWPVARFYDPSNPNSAIYESRIIPKRESSTSRMTATTRTGTGFNTWLAIDFVDPRWGEARSTAWRKMLQNTPRRDYYQYDESFFNLAMKDSEPIPNRTTTMLSQRHVFFTTEAGKNPNKITTMDQYLDELNRNAGSNIPAPSGFFDAKGKRTFSPSMLTTNMGYDTYMEEARRTVGIMEHSKLLRQKWLFTEELKKIGGLDSDIIEQMQNELVARLRKITTGIPTDQTVVPWAGIQIFNPEDPLQMNPDIYGKPEDEKRNWLLNHDMEREIAAGNRSRFSPYTKDYYRITGRDPKDKYHVENVKIKARGTGYFDPASKDEHLISYPRYSRSGLRSKRKGETKTRRVRSPARSGYVNWDSATASEQDRYARNQFAIDMYERDLEMETSRGMINMPAHVYTNRDIMGVFGEGSLHTSTQAQFDRWSKYPARMNAYINTPRIDPTTGLRINDSTLVTNSVLLRNEREEAWNRKTEAAEKYVQSKYPELYAIYRSVSTDSKDSYRHSIVVEFMRELHSMDMKRDRQLASMRRRMDLKNRKEQLKQEKAQTRNNTAAINHAIRLAILEEQRKAREMARQQRAMEARRRKEASARRRDMFDEEDGEGNEDTEDDIIPRAANIQDTGRKMHEDFARNFIAMATTRINAPWMGNWDMIKHWTLTWNDLVWSFIPPSKYYGYMKLASDFQWMMRTRYGQESVERYMSAMARGRAGLTKKPYRRECRQMIWKTTWER